MWFLKERNLEFLKKKIKNFFNLCYPRGTQGFPPKSLAHSQTVLPALGNTYTNVLFIFIDKLKGPSFPVEKKFEKKILRKENFDFCFSLCLPKGTNECPKKCQPIQSSRLAGQREHIYEYLVAI